MGLSGTVFLSFVVNKEGAMSDIRVTREVGGGCNEEALRVFKAYPLSGTQVHSVVEL